MQWLKKYGFPSDAIDARIFDEVSPLEQGMILSLASQSVVLPGGVVLPYMETPSADVDAQNAFIWKFLTSHYRNEAQALVDSAIADLESDRFSLVQVGKPAFEYERHIATLRKPIDDLLVGQLVLDEVALMDFSLLQTFGNLPFVDIMLNATEDHPAFGPYFHCFLIPDAFRKNPTDCIDAILTAHYAQ